MQGGTVADLRFWKHRLGLEDGSEVAAVPPKVPTAQPNGVNGATPAPTSQQVHVPPKRCLHTRIQSEDAVFADHLSHNVEGATVGTRQGLVLQPTMVGRHRI